MKQFKSKPPSFLDSQHIVESTWDTPREPQRNPPRNISRNLRGLSNRFNKVSCLVGKVSSNSLGLHDYQNTSFGSIHRRQITGDGVSSNERYLTKPHRDIKIKKMPGISDYISGVMQRPRINHRYSKSVNFCLPTLKEAASK